jgi:hypothetical protein
MKNAFSSMLLVLTTAGSLLAVNCHRTLQAISAKEVKVEIIINKEQLSSFARLSESIPVGAEIKYAKSEGGRLSIQDNKVKFIWLTLPSQNSITVSYIINTEALKEGNYAISGDFSYVDGTQTKELEISSNSFTINSNQVASIAPISAVENTLLNKNTTEKAVSSAKVTYAIQLVSTKDKLPIDYFTKNNIDQTMKVETIEGTNRYIFGEYQSSDQATAKRDSLAKKGFTDAFVVAYKNNQRITLEQAKQLESAK